MQARGPVKRAPKKKNGFKPSAAGRAYAAPKYTPKPKPASRSDAAQRHGARTPRPAPYRPTPAQVGAARAQERAYKSQGKAVKKVAHVQKAQGVGRPTGGRTLVTRVEAAGKVRRGKRREREAKAITKLVGFDPRDRYGNTPRVTKRNVMPVPKGLKKAYDLGYMETDPKKLKAAGFNVPGLAEKIVSAPKYAIKYTAKPAAELGVNAVTDTGELAVGTPTSLVHMGDIAQKGVRESVKQGSARPALKAGEEIAEGVIEPYKQLAKDPIGFATKHPVSTAAMILPVAKVPGAAAGRTARVAGKQTLKREPATLPGTSLKAQRVGSRQAGRRAVQARKDTRGKGKPHITEREINTMVDEDFDLGVLQGHAAQASKGRRLSKDLGRLTPKERARRVSPKRETRKQHREEVKARREREGGPGPLSVRERARRAPRAVSPAKEVRRRHAAEKAELSEHVQREIKGAAEGGRQTAERNFARRYGSHWYVDPESGLVVKPKHAPEGSGRIYATRAEAELIQKRLTAAKDVHFEPVIRTIKGDTAGETGGFAVVPKNAAHRMDWHHRAGGSKDPGAVVFRTGNRMFRKAVLPVSPRWLTGQATEGALRAAAMGAGPSSLLRYRRVMKELRKIDPDAAKRLEQRAISGGAFGDTGPIAAYTGGKQKTIAEEFAGTGPQLEKLAGKVTRAGELPIVGLKAPRKIYGRYTRVVFQDVNGAIERVAKKAMLGKAIKQGPLMERSLIDLSGKAARDAAHGLRETSHQVEAARGVVRAYGKYSQMSPAMRTTILHTTPFIPWMLNMGRFLGDVMPRDHPVKTALTAAMNQGDQEWRMSKGLSFEGKNRRPDFLLGSYPTGKDNFVPVGRFGPFLSADPLGDIGGQVAPQFTSALLNAVGGVDWKGEKIKGNLGVRALNTGITQAEAMIPGVGVLGRATGATEAARLQHKKEPKPSIVRGDKKLSDAVLDTVNPFRAIKVAPPKKKKKSSSGKAPLGGGTSGGKLPLGGGSSSKLPLGGG